MPAAVCATLVKAFPNKEAYGGDLQFLGDQFDVRASVGHVADLPSNAQIDSSLVVRPNAASYSVGSDALSDCIDCVAGKYVATTGSSAASDCIDCMAGKYLPVPGSNSSLDCIDCVAGKYVAGTAHTTDAHCYAAYRRI